MHNIRTPRRALIYGLPHRKTYDDTTTVVEHDEVTIADSPLNAPHSFLSFDIVCLFAGAFEAVRETSKGQYIRFGAQDLECRERETCTLIQQGKSFIMLAQPMSSVSRSRHRYVGTDSNTDLFQRITRTLGIVPMVLEHPIASLASDIVDFAEFISTYGTAHYGFAVPNDLSSNSREICPLNYPYVSAMAIWDRVFFLPTRKPRDYAEAKKIAVEAVLAVAAFQRRMSTQLPDWISEFRFSREAQLLRQIENREQELESLRKQMSSATKFKGLLCMRSEPLVELVQSVLQEVMGMRIACVDAKKEDLQVLDGKGDVCALIEIKGVNRNFKGEDVNQVNSHRERQGFPVTIPGVAIMNTLFNAESLKAKDLEPHHEVIEKAVRDRVLLIRTLDMARYIDMIESATATAEEFGRLLMSEVGWLQVDGGRAYIRRGK